MSEHRSNTIRLVIERSDHHCGDDLVSLQALSVIDTLMLVTVFPMYFMPNLVVYSGWNMDYLTGEYQMLLVHLLPFIFIVQTSTIWVTVLVGINRYIAVCMPYQVGTLGVCGVN